MSPADPLDYQRLAAELIRALRGKRSQTALSRRLGYKTNILYIWEARKGAPTASGFFNVADKTGVSARAALSTFYRVPPPWLSLHEPASQDGVAALLEDLKGGRTLVETARSLRCSRFALSRWLCGESQPRLPDFLQAIEATSLRLLDFVAAFVDPAQLPSVKTRWHELQQARRAAYEMPWSHAILRALELAQYAALDDHQPGWLAAQLGLEPGIEEEALELLAKTGQIEFSGGKWRPAQALTIDTRADPDAARRLKSWWLDVGAQRFASGAPGLFSYNLFGVSNRDLQRIEELQRSYFRELRNIVAQSEPVENVAVLSQQLFSLLTPEPKTPG